MAMMFEEMREWCPHCSAWRWFYRYLNGESKQWVCCSCSHSYYCGDDYR